MTIIDRILLELSAKKVVEDGMPDFTNEKHLLALNEVLIDLDWPMEARGELLYTLMEKENTEDKYPAVSIDDTGDGKGKKKTVYFKSKEKRDAAIKAGTHEKSSEKDPDDKKGNAGGETGTDGNDTKLGASDFGPREPTGTNNTGGEETDDSSQQTDKKEKKGKVELKDRMDSSLHHIPEPSEIQQKKEEEKLQKIKEKREANNKKYKTKKEKIDRAIEIVNTPDKEMNSRDKSIELASLIDPKDPINSGLEIIKKVSEGMDAGQSLPAGTPESTYA